MPDKIILSTVSAWALGERFDDTVAQKNAALREAKFAKLDGDLSENAPYQAAKEQFRTMGRIQRRLTKEMNALVAQGHTLVNPLTWVNTEPADQIDLGTVITVELAGAKDTFLVAGARDTHIPDEGEIVPTPYNSPLGKALLGHQAGDQFTQMINGNTQKITILEVRRPTTEEILNVFPALKETQG